MVRKIMDVIEALFLELLIVGAIIGILTLVITISYFEAGANQKIMSRHGYELTKMEAYTVDVEELVGNNTINLDVK